MPCSEDDDTTLVHILDVLNMCVLPGDIVNVIGFVESNLLPFVHRRLQGGATDPQNLRLAFRVLEAARHLFLKNVDVSAAKLESIRASLVSLLDIQGPVAVQAVKCLSAILKSFPSLRGSCARCGLPEQLAGYLKERRTPNSFLDKAFIQYSLLLLSCFPSTASSALDELRWMDRFISDRVASIRSSALFVLSFQSSAGDDDSSSHAMEAACSYLSNERQAPIVRRASARYLWSTLPFLIENERNELLLRIANLTLDSTCWSRLI